MEIPAMSLVPAPERIEKRDGTFPLSDELSITVEAPGEELPHAATLLARWLERALGSAPSVARGGDGAFRLRLDEAESEELGREGYRLDVKPDAVEIVAAGSNGLLYGVMTLRQLFPPEFEAGGGAATTALRCVLIVDRPRYAWRGLSFDCCRHFVEKAYLLRLLELMAFHKMNVFHWHLTEDQGWRLQIDHYPLLTEVAAWRGENRYGGFYTKDDVREVLAHAEKLGILVVPEIEMPGHSTAALAAYPALSCKGEPLEVSTKWGVHTEVYCAGREETFEFLQNVLDEVLELFPSPYIHIGGDEAPKERWKECPRCQERIRKEGLRDENHLQSWFIHRMGRYLRERGRNLIGWDEIAEGGVPEGAILQHWRYKEHLQAALENGHGVLLSNVDWCYMDFPYAKYDNATTDPPGKRVWMTATTPEKCYQYELIAPDLDEKFHAQILGGEATMWLEFAPPPEVDRQLWPRLCGLAEAFWTRRTVTDVHGFTTRLWEHCDRLDAMGVDYYRWLLLQKPRSYAPRQAP